nr:hypothetical protein [Tanacetum cinerariifolium]
SKTKDPHDAFIAKQYLTDHAAFTAMDWCWTKDFAMVSSAEIIGRTMLEATLQYSLAKLKQSLLQDSPSVSHGTTFKDVVQPDLSNFPEISRKTECF